MCGLVKGYGGMSRRQRFLQLDLPALRPLPPDPFRITAVQTDLRVARTQGLDQQPLAGTPAQPALPLTHEQVRGADYYR
ncbi:MAG: hypothetical protein BWY76_01022 [bacterium ADurb.Bin429]|nr:MAG: hypothetical protein BWY76_01022 [bacterium ADurb.Bin429]